MVKFLTAELLVEGEQAWSFTLKLITHHWQVMCVCVLELAEWRAWGQQPKTSLCIWWCKQYLNWTPQIKISSLTCTFSGSSAVSVILQSNSPTSCVVWEAICSDLPFISSSYTSFIFLSLELSSLADWTPIVCKIKSDLSFSPSVFQFPCEGPVCSCCLLVVSFWCVPCST